MTQAEMIVEYIDKFGSITSKDAFNDLGVTRLSARVADLKREGFAFEERWETSENGFGETVSYKRFSFKK